jgi:hypothetical protein
MEATSNLRFNWDSRVTTRYVTIFYRTELVGEGIRQLVASGLAGSMPPDLGHFVSSHYLRYKDIERVKWLSANRIDIDGRDPDIGYVVIPNHAQPGELDRLCEEIRKTRPDLVIDERNRYSQFDYQTKALLIGLVILAVAIGIIFLFAGR